jgi:hypothetical protein
VVIFAYGHTIARVTINLDVQTNHTKLYLLIAFITFVTSEGDVNAAVRKTMRGQSKAIGHIASQISYKQTTSSLRVAATQTKKMLEGHGLQIVRQFSSVTGRLVTPAFKGFYLIVSDILRIFVETLTFS